MKHIDIIETTLMALITLCSIGLVFACLYRGEAAFAIIFTITTVISAVACYNIYKGTLVD